MTPEKFLDSFKSLLLSCFFFVTCMQKQVEFFKIKIFSLISEKGGQKLFIKKYGPSPFQRRAARISTSHSFSLKQFQSLTWNPKKKVYGKSWRHFQILDFCSKSVENLKKKISDGLKKFSRPLTATINIFKTCPRS